MEEWSGQGCVHFLEGFLSVTLSTADLCPVLSGTYELLYIQNTTKHLFL